MPGKEPVSIKKLQSEIKNSGYDLVLDEGYDLEKDSGSLPIVMDGIDTGFEYFYSKDNTDFSNDYPDLDIKYQNGHNYMFAMHGDDSCIAAMKVASVLVTKFDGKAFDPQAGEFVDNDYLVDTARQCNEHVDLESILPLLLNGDEKGISNEELLKIIEMQKKERKKINMINTNKSLNQDVPFCRAFCKRKSLAKKARLLTLC